MPATRSLGPPLVIVLPPLSLAPEIFVQRLDRFHEPWRPPRVQCSGSRRISGHPCRPLESLVPLSGHFSAAADGESLNCFLISSIRSRLRPSSRSIPKSSTTAFSHNFGGSRIILPRCAR